MSSGKIEQLCKYLESNKAKNYPINNEFLSEGTDYIKNGYLKMLAVILQQPDEITEAQLSVFRRMVAGAVSDMTAEDYLRMALDIEIQDFANFTAECKEMSLKYRFVLDALILAGVNDRKDDQIKLVAEFCEALKVEVEEVEYLVTMARAILEMDTSEYVDACEKKAESVPDMVFQGYLYLLSKSNICSNENMTIFQPTCSQDVTVQTLERLKEIDTPIVKLINVEMDLSEYPLSFENKEQVILESCKFKGGKKHSIRFQDCQQVIISNTSFEGFNARTLISNRVGAMTISGSSFKDCIYTYSNSGDWNKLGGVIYTDSEMYQAIVIDDTEFENCGGINQKYYWRSAFISNAICNVNNGKFINCWNYHNHNGEIEIDPEDNCRTMFPSGSKQTHCTFENSANFC